MSVPLLYPASALHPISFTFSYDKESGYVQSEGSDCCGDGVECQVNKPTHRTIHWFKKGLRLHDNAALLHAISTSKIVYPVFIFDEVFIFRNDLDNAGPKRILFLMDTLKDLRKCLRELGSDLFIFMGDTETILKQKVKEWNITQLTLITDTEVFYRERDKQVMDSLEKMGVETHSRVGHTLYDITKIWIHNRGMPPLTYKKFVECLQNFKDPPLPVRAVNKADFESQIEVCDVKDDREQYETFITNFTATEENTKNYGWVGGETHALQRFKARCDFTTTGMSDEDSPWHNTTGLSPYLCLGSISPRLFFHTMKDIKYVPNPSFMTPESLNGQLIWRDFFYCVAAYTPNFTKMSENPICLQIEWDDNDRLLQAWKYGMTGYPWIDAIMRQLRIEGWISHLNRHCVACFLTRGDLWLSWERGQEVFEHWLLDADYSLNAGNWLWLSASAFYHKYNKIFHPVHFGKRTDPQGVYVRKYVSEISKLPSKYIYEPWKAPKDVQEKARCVIGRHYPHPIINHRTASAENIKRMKGYRARQQSTVELTIDSFRYYGVHDSHELELASQRRQRPIPASTIGLDSSSGEEAELTPHTSNRKLRNPVVRGNLMSTTTTTESSTGGESAGFSEQESFSEREQPPTPSAASEQSNEQLSAESD